MNSPACYYYANGKLKYQEWSKNGHCHRDGDLPALISYYDDGNVNYQYWHQNGIICREGDLPAYIEYHRNGNIKIQQWYKNGLPHRDGDLPAFLMYFEFGPLKYQEWYQNNRLHRETGPAIIEPNSHHWFLFGVEVSEKIVMRPHELTLEEVVNEEDAEERRIMIERMGVEKYLSLANPQILDVDSHNFNGTRALLKTPQGAWLVCACPSTGRVYHMEVPPETKICEEADQYLRGRIRGQIIGAS